MTYRRQTILSGCAAALLSALLFGAGGAGPAHSAPVSLDDPAMDRVTAGNTAEGGGVVIGNASGAAIGRSDRLGLSDDAQQNGEGLNIVNSAESAVADGVNIWDGNGVTAPDNGSTGSEVVVNQTNDITQEQMRSATVSGYSRPEAEEAELYSLTASESHDNRIVDSHDTTDIFEETRISSTTTTGNVNTRLKFNIDDKFDFEGNLGQGLASAGHTEIHFDGGSTDIALVLGGGISVEADSADFNKPLKIAGLDFGTTGIKAGIDVEAELSLTVDLQMPKLDIVLDGAGCAVAMGSCSASSATSEITHTRTDNSTLDIVEFYQSGQNSYSELHATSHRSPFELKSARAEYIVIDDSTLELESEVTLELTDSAQKDVKGMNVVNAIGSNVANATNVSRTKRFEGLWSTLVLNQVNTVHHGR